MCERAQQEPSSGCHFFYLIWIKDKRLERQDLRLVFHRSFRCVLFGRVSLKQQMIRQKVRIEAQRTWLNITSSVDISARLISDWFSSAVAVVNSHEPMLLRNVNKLPEEFTFSVDYAVKSLEWPAAKKKLGHSGHREYKLTDKPFQVYLRCRCNGDVVFRLASRLCDLIQRCNLTNSLQFVKDWTETRARARRPTSTDPLTRLRNDTKKLLNARVWKSFRRFISEREDLESDKKPGGALVVAWGPSWNLHPCMSGH